MSTFRWNEAVMWAVVSCWCVSLGCAFGFFGRQMVRIAEVNLAEIKKHLRSTLVSAGTKRAVSDDESFFMKAIWKVREFEERNVCDGGSDYLGVWRSTHR